MSHHRTAYEDILRAAGHRVTRQRIQILDAVCEGEGHTTLAAVYVRVRRHAPTIDLSTIYRTLRLFTSVGLVICTTSPFGEDLYEMANPIDHHYHLLCRRCGAQQEIAGSVLGALFAEIEAASGFEVDGDHLVIGGVCGACRARQP
jgi:Fur family transcriptional regulator, ferric uptake regulator